MLDAFWQILVQALVVGDAMEMFPFAADIGRRFIRPVEARKLQAFQHVGQFYGGRLWFNVGLRQPGGAVCRAG